LPDAGGAARRLEAISEARVRFSMAQPSPIPKPKPAHLRKPAPLLASDALRDELAPFEPAGGACRGWLLGDAVALALLGVALRLGAGHGAIVGDAATISFSAAGALVALAALPFPYASRGAVALLVGAALMTLGLRGAGPLAGLAWDGGVARDALRLVALSVLPPALLFRARYRIYAPARALVAIALLVALPYAGLEAALAVDAGAVPAVRAAAVASALAVASGALGFLPAAMSGAATISAATILWLLPLGIAARALGPLSGEAPLAYPATAVAMLCAALPVCIGLHHVLSWIFGPAARRLALGAARQLPDEEA